MPRPPAAEPRDQQLLLRLTRADLDVLEAIAHLERKKPNGYAYEVLVAHLTALRSNPRVQADLENRAAYEDDRGSTAQIRRTARAKPEEIAEATPTDTASA